MFAAVSTCGTIALAGPVKSDVTPGPWPAMNELPCATIPMLTKPVR